MVKNYQEVFLPGQLTAALQAQTLSAKAQQNLQAITINKDLLTKAWWNKQPAAQLPAALAAHSIALTALTNELLGFDIASPPPAAAPLAVGKLDEQLAHDTFDQAAATQLLHDAAQADKLAASPPLVEAVSKFNALVAQAATTSPSVATDQQALRKAVKAQMERINAELQRYPARVGAAGKLFQTQRDIQQSTTGYLASNEPKKTKK